MGYMRTVSVHIADGHPLYDYCDKIIRLSNNLSDAVRFRQRQVITAVSKNEADRTDNERGVMDEIRAANASKVYILLGTNSLVSYDDESLLHYYDEFLTLLESELPAGTTYYVQAIPPFSADKAAQSEEYSNERIRNLNEQIALMAYARGWHYLDLYSALADENGDQRADYSAGDGVHLNEAGYTAWREFLITHTAYDKDSPYIAGSPYLIS